MQEQIHVESDQAIDEYLYVGMPAIYYPDVDRDNQPRYRTSIRGWRTGSQILIDRPTMDNGRLLAMNVIKKCALKFIRGGEACAATCHVIEWDTRSQFPVARLSWPQDFHRVGFRRHERVSLQAACTIRGSNGQEYAGTMMNLSEGGCRVVLNERPEGRKFEIDCNIPHGPLLRRVEVELKHLAEVSERVSIGFMFEAMEIDLQSALADCVGLLRGLQSAGERVDNSKPCVVVLDGDGERVRQLRDALAPLELSLFVAQNPMEGLARLGLPGVLAIAVAEDLDGFAPKLLIEIIQSSQRHNSLPIILYGTKDVRHHSLQAVQALASNAPDAAGLLDNLFDALSQKVPSKG